MPHTRGALRYGLTVVAIVSKPDDDLHGEFIHVARERDLLVALGDVILGDADRINPDGDGF